jgi:hypothetical protein
MRIILSLDRASVVGLVVSFLAWQDAIAVAG